MVRVIPSRIIGLDYGLARIGVALSDERKIIATGSVTIAAEKKAEATAQKIGAELNKLAEAQKFTIEKIVLGFPLKMDGTRGLQADEVADFAELLKQVLQCEIVLWDERLTTVQADRSLREGNLTRKQRAKQMDKVAAVLILQSYLDSLAFS